MHPMFVQLYLQSEADDDEATKHRRANRARRHRSRAAVRVTARATRPRSASVGQHRA